MAKSNGSLNKKKTNNAAENKEQLSQEAKRIFSKYLQTSKQESNELETNAQSEEQDFLSLIELQNELEHKKTIDAFLTRNLAPEMRLNEKQKRNFKERLMRYILIILSIQLGVFLLVVICFALAFCFNTSFTNSITLDQLKYIVEFLKYYISAVIVEFIAMLFFIVKFVFDRSIVGLIKQLFKKEK